MARLLRVLVCLGIFGLFTALVLAADGQAVYQKSCRTCHGADGKGNAKLAKNVLKVKSEQLDLLKEATVKKDDAQLREAVKKGTGKMKPMGKKMKDEEIAVSVDYLRTLQKKK